MGRLTGFAGISFKSRDPRAPREWHARHPDVAIRGDGARFGADAAPPEATPWAPVGMDTKYCAPGTQEFIVHFRVDDLDALPAKAGASGLVADPDVHHDENGRFGWIRDPHGTPIEWWQPPSARMPS